MPDYGRSISRNVASLKILVHHVIKLLYYEHWANNRKYFYVYKHDLSPPFSSLCLLVVLWASYNICNIIRDVKLWFLRCGCKVNLFCDNQVLITHWWKKDKKFTFSKNSFSWKCTVTVNLKKFSSNTTFRWYTFGKFFIVKFNYSSGRLIRWKRYFWSIFDWPLDHCVGDIGNRNITGNY